ncbi:MAG: alpha/beta fold hydrolase [Chthoniobacterales bacterium]
MNRFAALLILLPLSVCAHTPAPTPGAAPTPKTNGNDVYAPGREVVADINRIATANRVDETFEVTLGGARQVVNVRGADRANPVILFVHGGPGAVEMPIAWSFQRPWEDFFTVVQWDQRGAGRSFLLEDSNTLAPTLKPERYRDDAIELIELLCRRYDKRKVLLLGHSWGSVVGLSVAAKRPDLLYGYIGMGQVIDFIENERVGLDWTLERAREDKNDEAIHALEALRPYPAPEGLDQEKMTVERRWNIHYGGLAWGRDNGDFYFHAARLSPLYTAADRKAWDDGSEFTIKHVWSQLAKLSFKDLHKLDVPVMLFLGRHDYTAPSPIAQSWLNQVDAPKKQIVWFENSAHLPMLEEPGRTLAALLQHVRPLAEGEQSAGTSPIPR